MSNVRWSFYSLIAFLFVSGVGLSIYRHIEYKIPWWPEESLVTWTVEARVKLESDSDATSVRLIRPLTQNNYTLLDESTASPGFGVAYLDDEYAVEWTKREVTGVQTLFYRATFLVDDSQMGIETKAPDIPSVIWDEPYQTAARQILDEVKEKSADPVSFAQQLFIALAQDNENTALLKTEESNITLLAVRLLNQNYISASTIYALKLEDGRRRQTFKTLVKVWFDDSKAVIFDPVTGMRGVPKNHLLWSQRPSPILDVVGGYNSNVTFSIIRQRESVSAAIRAQQKSSHDLISFSIHALPLEEQALFKTILLLPVGALIVCLLRILIGLKTSGTFMPVLIAVAFIQTSLVTGLVGFLLVVFFGLLLRSYLSRLNLLLVARISAVIITVIAIIGIFSVTSYQIGLNEGLKITFFPMIILAWTIERMSILWEEEGSKEVFVQGGGSLLTALFAYLAMTNDLVRHLTFNFLGVQLMLLAFILALGNYTGYRLFELVRFKSMVK